MATPLEVRVVAYFVSSGCQLLQIMVGFRTACILVAALTIGRNLSENNGTISLKSQ